MLFRGSTQRKKPKLKAARGRRCRSALKMMMVILMVTIILAILIMGIIILVIIIIINR